jgi:hypothetical protein
VPAFIETSAVYRCGVVGCEAIERIPLPPGETGAWDHDYDWVRDHLPPGWLRVHGRPGGTHGESNVSEPVFTWLACGVDCLTELIDRARREGITWKMRP